MRASQPRTSRDITNHLLCRLVVPRLHRRPNSTLVNNNKQALPHRPVENSEAANHLVDPWETIFSSKIARGKSTNSASRLQEKLDEAGHHVWGFVIYRCTYGDDAAWEECLRRLNLCARRGMHFYEALDLFDDGEDGTYRFKQTIFQDAALFDGASTQVVRRHFKAWRARAFDEEQGSNAKIEAWRQREDLGPPYKAGVRYRWCIAIDDEALRSIMSLESPSTSADAWINLIEADWDLETILARREEDRIEGLESGYFDSDEDFYECLEFGPEIEGCTEEDVGWMRVDFQFLIPDFYDSLNWPMPDDMYVRPPGVAS